MCEKIHCFSWRQCSCPEAGEGCTKKDCWHDEDETDEPATSLGSVEIPLLRDLAHKWEQLTNNAVMSNELDASMSSGLCTAYRRCAKELKDFINDGA